MQHMQDKKFDELFKDRFEGAEIEPSMDLWNNIEGELDPKRKRIVPVFWMVAASVMVGVLAIALIFNGLKGNKDGALIAVNAKPGTLDNKPGKLNSKPGQLRSSSGIPPAVTIAPVVTAESSSPASAQSERNYVAAVSAKTSISSMESSKRRASEVYGAGSATKKDLTAMQPAERIARLNNQQVIAKMDFTDLPKAKVHEAQAEIPTQKDAIVLANTNTPLATADEVGNENDEAVRKNDEADRKGIRNVGDLINFVVDKVDKREDKFLKFKTDDDDNSSLIGINIGMLKFSKRK